MMASIELEPVVDHSEVESYYKYIKKVIFMSITFIGLGLLFGVAALIVGSQNWIAALFILLFAIILVITGFIALIINIRRYYGPYEPPMV